MADFDVAVIGAGLLGMATAAAIAGSGRSVLVLERHPRPGQETSSRHSGVIHAGLYYEPGSLKATACIEGRELLYRRCQKYGIGHRRLGKLVVATAPAQREALEGLLARSHQNGATEVRLIEGHELRRLEPNLRAVAALWSPMTGIVDSHELLASYRFEAREGGAILCFGTELLGVEKEQDGYTLVTRGLGSESHRVRVRTVVNAAGLFSDRIATLAGFDVEALGYRLHFCKGDYFALDSRFTRSISHLVYPLPEASGLGIHLTFDLGGRLRAGPDTEYVSELDYRVDESKAPRFASCVARYLPGVEAHHLSADGSGIRPKLQGPAEPARDFLVREEADRGYPQWINAIGIESPGLTASEALARRIAGLVE